MSILDGLVTNYHGYFRCTNPDCQDDEGHDFMAGVSGPEETATCSTCNATLKQYLCQRPGTGEVVLGTLGQIKLTKKGDNSFEVECDCGTNKYNIHMKQIDKFLVVKCAECGAEAKGIITI